MRRWFWFLPISLALVLLLAACYMPAAPDVTPTPSLEEMADLGMVSMMAEAGQTQTPMVTESPLASPTEAPTSAPVSEETPPAPEPTPAPTPVPTPSVVEVFPTPAGETQPQPVVTEPSAARARLPMWFSRGPAIPDCVAVWCGLSGPGGLQQHPESGSDLSRPGSAHSPARDFPDALRSIPGNPLHGPARRQPLPDRPPLQHELPLSGGLQQHSESPSDSRGAGHPDTGEPVTLVVWISWGWATGRLIRLHRK